MHRALCSWFDFGVEHLCLISKPCLGDGARSFVLLFVLKMPPSHVRVQSVDAPFRLLVNFSFEIKLLEHLFNRAWDFTVSDMVFQKLPKVVRDSLGLPSLIWSDQHVIINHIKDSCGKPISSTGGDTKVFVPLFDDAQHLFVVMENVQDEGLVLHGMGSLADAIELAYPLFTQDDICCCNREDATERPDIAVLENLVVIQGRTSRFEPLCLLRSS